MTETTFLIDRMVAEYERLYNYFAGRLVRHLVRRSLGEDGSLGDDGSLDEDWKFKRRRGLA